MLPGLGRCPELGGPDVGGLTVLTIIGVNVLRITRKTGAKKIQKLILVIIMHYYAVLEKVYYHSLTLVCNFSN